jgi:hypothetical protein
MLPDMDKSTLLPVLATVAIAAVIIGCARVAPSKGLIEYHRTGGVAGLDDRLVIDESYKATLTRKTKSYDFVLTRDLGDRLVQQLVQADFARLKVEYIPANTCCDLIEYAITYKGHTVRTMDTAVPAQLQPVLDSLNEIIQSRGKS